MTMTDAAVASTSTGFDPLFGRWLVRHRRLDRIFQGCTTWREFIGTSETRPVLGGCGNIEDNVIDDPLGGYRAIAIRSFDPQSANWSIWWLDGRRAAIEPPVVGRIADGGGELNGTDVLDGTPISVRFRWRGLNTGAPHWEQAFSRDGGDSWETNWTMAFTPA